MQYSKVINRVFGSNQPIKLHKTRTIQFATHINFSFIGVISDY
jgi:hypothetical protein